ncbi:MAG: hypothetical protein DHS20C15_13110 [Planctomycetota bacterium]|nr:MAG: hypothetical protein DHS20C15_13110 [Planctomycetota bacterium]
MRALLRLTPVALLLLAACGAPPKTQVFVLGMIHGDHLTNERWGVQEVRDTIAAIDPDVVCAEIPPDRWERVAAEWREFGEVRDDRVQRFPEYTHALLPLWSESSERFVIEPCAAWTQQMHDARVAALKVFAEDPLYAEAHRAYEFAEAEMARRHAASPIDASDPRVIHSALYDERTRQALRPYDRYLNDYLGAGGWTNINAAHWALIAEALDRHRGKRVLIMFGAGHKHWFLDRLREREDVELVEVEPWLPRGVALTP